MFAVDSRVAKTISIFRLRDKMYGIKIPQQDFALKMQGGGAYVRRGDVFAGHYGIWSFYCDIL